MFRLLLIVVVLVLVAPFAYSALLSAQLQDDTEAMLERYRDVADSLEPMQESAPPHMRMMIRALQQTLASSGALSMHARVERVAQARDALERIHSAAQSGALVLDPAVQRVARELDNATSSMQRYNQHAATWNAWARSVLSYPLSLIGSLGESFHAL